MKLEVIILAAGQGTRMKSSKPKVLHDLAGRPMLEHVIGTAHEMNSARIHVVYGHGGDQIHEQLGHQEVDWVEQSEQLGTGHAVLQAIPGVSQDCVVLILYGDVPLIQKNTLERLVETANERQMGLLTIALPDPGGYGRIVRDEKGQVIRIVEHKDASTEQQKINEINTGIMAARASHLKKWLGQLDNNNSQGEYYLTDIIEMAVNDNVKVLATTTEDEVEVTGINDMVQLEQMERACQRRQAETLMRNGVTLADAGRFDCRGECKTGHDVFIDVNAILEGNVTLGDRVKIGPNVLIRNSTIHDDVEILANSIIDQAEVGGHSHIGPFARLRPGSMLSENTHIGNFVEIKKSTVGKGSKINHLSYIGDSEIGSSVNIGAGTITCNYDGANKFKTIIGNNCFIGSGTQLVAPVTIGKGSTIGAGSTITRDTPEVKLTLSRSKQVTIESWQRPRKKKK